MKKSTVALLREALTWIESGGDQAPSLCTDIRDALDNMGTPVAKVETKKTDGVWKTQVLLKQAVRSNTELFTAPDELVHTVAHQRLVIAGLQAEYDSQVERGDGLVTQLAEYSRKHAELLRLTIAAAMAYRNEVDAAKTHYLAAGIDDSTCPDLVALETFLSL